MGRASEEVSYRMSGNLPDKEEGKQNSEQRIRRVPESGRQDVLGHWKQSSVKPVVDRGKKEIKLRCQSRLGGGGSGYGIWPLS